jgi:uncharacterized protein YndB with AHSA1/START domain
MSTTMLSDELGLQVDLDVVIKASPAKVFAAMLKQLSSEFGPDGNRMTMALEPFPGGRWYRDLGNNQGHFWGHVQVIKQDKLLEIFGPLFMSYPAMNHLQFRLTPEGDKTRLTFKHHGIGKIDPQHREGVTMGWQGTLDSIRTQSEK